MPRRFSFTLLGVGWALAAYGCGASSIDPSIGDARASGADATAPPTPPPPSTHADAGAPPRADASTPDPDASGGGGDLPGWRLTWSDEFNGPDGSEVDASKWHYDVGTGEEGWGNKELEYYTSGTANAVVTGGALVITGTTQGASQFHCWYGTCKYVSARLTTSHHFAQRYGRFEARIQVPRGKGVWPAFWMLGDGFPNVTWPECGEIDVMENLGSEPSIVHGTAHGPGPADYVDVGLTGSATLASGALADDFHVYAVEWEASAMRFLFDGTVYETVVPADVPPTGKWVWDHPYFLLLNFAIGGEWPGSPDATTKWPQTMKVDYVRVYERVP